MASNEQMRYKSNKHKINSKKIKKIKRPTNSKKLPVKTSSVSKRFKYHKKKNLFLILIVLVFSIGFLFLQFYSTNLDCNQIKDGGNHTDGLYQITISNQFIWKSLQAFCDMSTDENAWIVIQKRYDGSVDFKQSSQYIEGFGSLKSEFWLGLENIHQITQTGKWILRIDLTVSGTERFYAEYSNFKVGGAPDYNLILGGYIENTETLPGDLLSKDPNRKIFPVAFNSSMKECTNVYESGWWYGNCIWWYGNLNSLQYSNTPGNTGLIYLSSMGSISLSSSKMKIRRS